MSGRMRLGGGKWIRLTTGDAPPEYPTICPCPECGGKPFQRIVVDGFAYRKCLNKNCSKIYSARVFRDDRQSPLGCLGGYEIDVQPRQNWDDPQYYAHCVRIRGEALREQGARNEIAEKYWAPTPKVLEPMEIPAKCECGLCQGRKNPLHGFTDTSVVTTADRSYGAGT